MIGIKSTYQNLSVSTVYYSSKHNLTIEDYKTLVQHPGERFIIRSDVNAKYKDWGSRVTTTKERELREGRRNVSFYR